MMTTRTPPPWSFAESIAAELDFALSLSVAEGLRSAVPSFEPATRDLSPDWLAQGHELFGRLSSDFSNVLLRLATATGLELEGDYGACTLRLRDLSPADLTDALARAARALDLEPWADPAQGLVELVLALRAPLELVTNRAGLEIMRREAAFSLRVLRGGDEHSRFWHWVDRFYYETYRPWRLTREPFMTTERERALAALSLPPAPGAPLRLDWLPPQNPVNQIGALGDLVRSGAMPLVFWVEPFGTWDYLDPLPGGALVSFCTPGEAYEAFRRLSADLAGRLKALSDPTRLVMLRFVRQHEVDNSQIAGYLEVSNPTISVHAKLLREAGLIQTRRRGRSVVHDLDEAAVRALLRELQTFLGLAPEP